MAVRGKFADKVRRKRGWVPTRAAARTRTLDGCVDGDELLQLDIKPAADVGTCGSDDEPSPSYGGAYMNGMHKIMHEMRRKRSYIDQRCVRTGDAFGHSTFTRQMSKSMDLHPDALDVDAHGHPIGEVMMMHADCDLRAF